MKEGTSGGTVHVLGIAGSLRKGSYNKSALRAAMNLAPAGMEIEAFDLEGIPPFNQDNEQNPPARVSELKAKIRSSDAVLFVTPEYNHSIPGVLKNAIDWGSRPYGDNSWGGKPVAVMGASNGRIGTARSQNHLRQVLLAVNMHALNRPDILIADAPSQFDDQGNLLNDTTKGLIVKLLNNLIDWTRMLKKAGG